METMILNVLYVCTVALILVRRSWGSVGGKKIELLISALSSSWAQDDEKVSNKMAANRTTKVSNSN